MKQLTIRKAGEHEEMFNQLLTQLQENSASKALIKAGYEYLRLKEKDNQSQKLIQKLTSEIEQTKSHSRDLLNGLHGLKNLIEK